LGRELIQYVSIIVFVIKLFVGNTAVLCCEACRRNYNSNFATIWTLHRWQFLVSIA